MIATTDKEVRDVVTVAEAANLVRYTEKHIRRLIACGALPARQRGKKCRILIEREELTKAFPHRYGV